MSPCTQSTAATTGVILENGSTELRLHFPASLQQFDVIKDNNVKWHAVGCIIPPTPQGRGQLDTSVLKLALWTVGRRPSPTIKRGRGRTGWNTLWKNRQTSTQYVTVNTSRSDDETWFCQWGGGCWSTLKLCWAEMPGWCCDLFWRTAGMALKDTVKIKLANARKKDLRALPKTPVFNYFGFSGMTIPSWVNP